MVFQAANANNCQRGACNVKKATYEDLGLIKVSVLLETQHENVAKALYLDPLEWILLADSVAKDPTQGYRGQRFVLPPGVRVLILRSDDPTHPTAG